MKTIAKPYKTSPYTAMVKLKAPWIADVKARVTKRITEYEQFLENEAQIDGQPELTDDKFLYETFKHNVEHNMAYGLLHVLKYFNIKFRMKILYDMIGQWKFTDQDVEIYNHFRNTSYRKIAGGVNTTKLRYATGKAPNIYVHDNTCKWITHVGKESEFYLNFFHQEIVLIIDATRMVKGLDLLIPDRTFFDGGHLHEGLNLSQPMDFDELGKVVI